MVGQTEKTVLPSHNESGFWFVPITNAKKRTHNKCVHWLPMRGWHCRRPTDDKKRQHVFHPNRATLRIAMASERTGHNATMDVQRRAQADKTSETLGFSINYL
jgi:hypothetical protein